MGLNPRQGLTVIVTLDSAVASQGLEADSVIAVVQVITAFLSACRVIVTKMESLQKSVTRTQVDVSVREMLPVSGVIPVGKAPFISTSPTLWAAPVVSASEPLTSVRVPVSAGGSLLRCMAGVWKVQTRKMLHLC